MLCIVLAETALETIPAALAKNAAIQLDAKRAGKPVESLLLDASRHSSAMEALPGWKKRGRPDIAQFCLLLALDHPLNKDGRLKVFIHTCNNQLILVDPEARLPRVFHRFCGVFQDLFSKKKLEANGKALLELRDNISLADTISLARLSAGSNSQVIVFDQSGKLQSFKEMSSSFQSFPDSVAVIGGFPNGGFSDEKALQDFVKISISKHELCAWTAVSEALCAYSAGQEE